MKQPSTHRLYDIDPLAPELPNTLPGTLPGTIPGTLPDTLLDPALLRALETAPQCRIPADFASRVRSLAVSQVPRPQPRWVGALGSLRHLTGSRSVAGWVTLASGVLLLAALFVFAPGTTPSFLDLHFDLELLLLGELGGVCYVFARLSAR